MGRIARLADLVLYDIKAAPDDYLRLVGMSYNAAAASLRLVRKVGRALWLRLPLVPGVNDTVAHFENIARLAWEHRPNRIEIIPYHAMGAEKLRRFGISDESAPSMAAVDGHAERCLEHLRGLGVEARLPSQNT